MVYSHNFPSNIIESPIDSYPNKNLPVNNEESSASINNNGNKDEGLFRLRSASIHVGAFSLLTCVFPYFSLQRKFDPPSSLGRMNIYIGERRQNGIRPRFQRHRFPVARFSRQRFRMYLHIGASGHVQRTSFQR